MKCVREDLKAHITDVLFGEAEPSLKTEVLAHIETCASCQADRDQMTAVLGLLKEAPPWVEGGEAAKSADADALSVIQRQKIESLAARRATGDASASSSAKKKKSGGLPASWLAMAASLAAVGMALVLAQRSSEKPVQISEPPAPATTAGTTAPNQLPQAPEAPELAAVRSLKADSLTEPASARQHAHPSVTVAPEALREFKRQQESPEQAALLDQAAEKNEFQPAKKAAPARDERAAAGANGGVAGGAMGGDVTPAAPAMRAAPALRPAPAESKLEYAEPSAAALEKDKAREAAGQRGSVSDYERVRALTPEEITELREQAKRAGTDLDGRLANRPVPPPARPNDMYFEAKGTNPFIVTEEDALATFGLDVDTASYTLTRNYLNRGTLPPPAAVRVEEFVNSFPNNVAAERGRDGESAFAVRVDGAPNPLHPGYHIIRVAMKAKDVDPRERKSAHLTFVIDVSGSMAAQNRLGLVKRSLALLVDKLDERDTIGIVVYGTNGRRVLVPTPASNRDRIMAVINRLTPEGSTNLEDGLNLGYEMAMEQFQRGSSNRVVLCTDGVANTGQTEADSLLSRIRNEAKRGIDMMALGFGMGNYNDALLQRLADEGNGQYAYIDDLGEARAFFLRRLTSVLEVVARDAKAQVEFNPSRVERYRLLGYEKRDVADRDFRNDSVDAGEINSGHSVTALFEVKLRGGSSAGKIGTARIRYKTGPRSEGIEFAREIADEAIVRSFDQASPAFRTAFVASRFAEHLRKSYWVKDEALTSVLSLAEELPETTQTNELTDLIRKATRLIKPQIREDW